VSPDGRWLAYVSNESGRNEVYIQRLADLGGGRQKVSREGGRAPVWRRDGRELFYVTGGEPRHMIVIDVRPGADFSAGTPRVLFDLPVELMTSAFPIAGYDASKDGGRFLFVREVRGVPPSPPSQMHVILNWFEELKAKVPAGK
jgi:Tol biopolymer transport system component